MSQFGEDAGAIGFAVNVDAVARALLNQRGIEISPVEVLVYGEAGFEMEALAHLNSLTQQGIRAEFALFDTKEEALNNARKNGISRLDVLSSAGVQSVAAETGGTV